MRSGRATAHFESVCESARTRSGTVGEVEDSARGRSKERNCPGGLLLVWAPTDSFEGREVEEIGRARTWDPKQMQSCRALEKQS